MTRRKLLIVSLLCLGFASAGCSKSEPSPFVRVVRVFYTSGGNVLAPGQQLQLQAEALYSDERKEDVTGTATWRSQDAAIATVGGAGLVTAGGEGATSIIATFQGTMGLISLRVQRSAGH